MLNTNRRRFGSKTASSDMTGARMPVTTNMGATHEEHGAMLDHLITIGRALHTPGRAWGEFDNLEAIVGIGPNIAAQFRDDGIVNANDLANLTDAQRQAIIDLPGINERMLSGWEAQARRMSENLNPKAMGYLDKVQESAGFGAPIERTGWVNVLKREGDREAKVFSYDLYDAPEEHRASERLAGAIRAYRDQSDGRARVPNLTEEHVHILELWRGQKTNPLSDREVEWLNGSLESAGIVLRREGDPPQNIPDAMAPIPQYDRLPPPPGPGEYVDAAAARPLYTAPDPPAFMDADRAKVPRPNEVGTRVEGSGSRPPTPHDPNAQPDDDVDATDDAEGSEDDAEATAEVTARAAAEEFGEATQEEAPEVVQDEEDEAEEDEA
jgi:hypothetical protein